MNCGNKNNQPAKINGLKYFTLGKSKTNMNNSHLRLLFFILLMFASHITKAQKQAAITFTGIDQLKLGAGFKTVSKLLEPKPDYNFAYRLSAGVIKKRGENPDDYYLPGPKQTYTLKRKNTSYFTFWNIPVQKIEITFDTTNRIKEILLFFKKNESNMNTLRAEATSEFGGPSCSYGLDEKHEGVILSTYCFWTEGASKFLISDFYGNSPEAMPADHIWIEFSLN